jgi:hypothetical protein
MKKLAEFRVHHMANKVSDVSTVGDQNYDTDHQDMSKPACQEAMDKPTEARAAQCDGFVPWATVKSQLDPLLDMLEATVAAAAEAAAVMGVSGAADGDDLAAGTAVVLTDMSAANVALNGQRAVVVRRLVKMKIEAYEVRVTPGATTSARSKITTAHLPTSCIQVRLEQGGASKKVKRSNLLFAEEGAGVGA